MVSKGEMVLAWLFGGIDRHFRIYQPVSYFKILSFTCKVCL